LHGLWRGYSFNVTVAGSELKYVDLTTIFQPCPSRHPILPIRHSDCALCCRAQSVDSVFVFRELLALEVLASGVKRIRKFRQDL